MVAIYPLHIADRENSRYIQDAPSHKTGPWWPHRLQNTPPCTPTQDLLLHISKILHWTPGYNSLFIVYGPPTLNTNQRPTFWSWRPLINRHSGICIYVIILYYVTPDCTPENCGGCVVFRSWSKTLCIYFLFYVHFCF